VIVPHLDRLSLAAFLGEPYGLVIVPGFNAVRANDCVISQVIEVVASHGLGLLRSFPSRTAKLSIPALVSMIWIFRWMKGITPMAIERKAPR
jgi:hypothetical protein